MRRRDFLALGAAATAALTGRRLGAAKEAKMLARKIPRSGEMVPAIGLGTWQTFDVGEDAKQRAPLIEVLLRFFARGGRLVDSSPMYGRAEAVVGDLWHEIGRPQAFMASKVWTTGKKAGEKQMAQSLARMRQDTMDLMQVHNLEDWKTHLGTMRAWREAKKVRYLGITHYSVSAFDEMERILRSEKLDFVQLPYSVAMRAAEKRLLPAAADTGTAVIVMRPFEGGSLFARTRKKPLPDFAADLGCTSWAQLFLKFILGHPAVTAPIPATQNPKHLDDNLGAGLGRLPTAAERKRIIELAA